MAAIPCFLRKTLTRDRGTENMGWEDIEKVLSLSVHFAHSYCSYERGSNENLNGLVRRFFPKKTDFAKVTDEEIHRVEYLLNTRPRKRFKHLSVFDRAVIGQKRKEGLSCGEIGKIRRNNFPRSDIPICLRSNISRRKRDS